MAPFISTFIPQITQHVGDPFVMKVIIIKPALGALMEQLKETLEIFEKLIQEGALRMHEGSRNMMFV